MLTAKPAPSADRKLRTFLYIAAYRDVFSDRYQALGEEIAAMRKQIVQQFGDGAIGHLNKHTERNNGAVEFWSRYCDFDSAPLSVPDEIPCAMRALGQAAVALLDRKDRVPLEPIQPDDVFNTANTNYEATHAKRQQIADAIQTVKRPHLRQEERNWRS